VALSILILHRIELAGKTTSPDLVGRVILLPMDASDHSTTTDVFVSVRLFSRSRIAHVMGNGILDLVYIRKKEEAASSSVLVFRSSNELQDTANFTGGPSGGE